MEYVHILRIAKEPEGEKMMLAEMKKTMPPCPICGKKAYLMHNIIDGFDYGYDAGCPSFCLDDGVHGISESYHPDAPHIQDYTAKLAYDGWLAYCGRMKGRADNGLDKPESST